MTKLKLVGPALVSVMLLPSSFAQDTTASTFAKQVERDIAALSSQPSVGEWQIQYPGEKLELANYDDATEVDHSELRLDYDSWCASLISQLPSTFGRAAIFFLPDVKANALPPLPDKASVQDGCRLQAFQYSASSEIPIEDLIREFSSAWGTPSRRPSGPLDNLLHSTTWEHEGVSIRLEFRVSYGPGAEHEGPLGVIVYAKRDALPAVPCPDCKYSLLFPLFREKEVLLLQRAAQIADQDPALTRQIIEWSREIDNPQWGVEPSVALSRLRSWLEVVKSRPVRQRAAALLLADFYVEGTRLNYVAKPDGPVDQHPAFYKDLGAEYDKYGTYRQNFLQQAEKLDDGGEVNELGSLWKVSELCPVTDKPTQLDETTERGDGLLERFPSDQWSPYVHFAVARAHSIKLLRTYPGGSIFENDGKILPLSAEEKKHERDEALANFKAFLDAKPAGPPAAFAWLEVWRLLAGIPSTEQGWGCTGE